MLASQLSENMSLGFHIKNIYQPSLHLASLNLFE